jgi:hypothetical protein
MGCSSKIVVFDLDETLGYFMELGMFWDALKGYIKHKQLKITINQELFNKILDLYPEFLRPNILVILNYLKKKKQKNHCDKLMIYTNNQGPTEWAKYIMGYFDDKLNYKLFDQIIAAFKVQGKRVELCRTTHSKTHSDFIKCTKVPEDTQICFLDDVFYPDMSNEKIYYINVKPYIYDLDFDEMLKRFLNSNILDADIDPQVYNKFMKTYLDRYHHNYVAKSNQAQEIDKILSKKILHHLHLFFKINSVGPHTNKTKRNKIKLNKTLKKRVKNEK